jgi:hypothetical protein
MFHEVGQARSQTTISPDLSTALPEEPNATPVKGSFKRALNDHVEAQQKSMKRSRAQLSPTMSPGASNEGFNVNGTHPTTNGPDAEAVTIVGAGPAGLMLGYAP